jgi:hypothetical protein
MRIVSSFLAAILLPTSLLTAWYLYGQFSTFEADDPYIWVRTRNFLVICITMATAYVIVLGVPTYLLLRKLNAVRWWSTIASGFILGAIPVAILSWPLRYFGIRTSATVNGVETIVDGVPTYAGWLQYASGVSFVGAIGAVGAIAFWAVSRK